MEDGPASNKGPHPFGPTSHGTPRRRFPIWTVVAVFAALVIGIFTVFAGMRFGRRAP